MANLIEIIKKAAVDAVQASRPVNVVYGVVTSADPLKIQIDQKITLDEPFLVLTRNVTDYQVEVSMDHMTEVSGVDPHQHAITGKKTVTMHNALKLGDKVVMMMSQGGQSYVVLDKVVTT